MNGIESLSDLSQQALDQFKKALATGKGQPGDPRAIAQVNKAIDTGTGLVWYDLQAPAKNMIPVITPLRNKIPRVPGNGGTATNWKSVTAINTSHLRAGVPEGRRNGTVATSVTPKSATYAALGLEDSVTFEAELAGVNFENVRAMTAQRLLWATMIEEELTDLGGNNSLALSVPSTGLPVLATPTYVASNSGVLDDATYYVNVVALDLFGYLSATVSLAGVPDLTSVTSADGAGAFTFGGGSSLPSAQGSVATTKSPRSGSYLTLSCTPVTGAVAYAWYVSTVSGHAKLQAITTTNVAIVGKSALLTNTQDVASLSATDQSTDAYVYDGLLTQAMKAASGAYVKTLNTDTTDYLGTQLTSNGAGGITEFDAMFKDRWDNYRLGVDEIWVNAQEALSATKLILGNGGATYPITHRVVEAGEAGDVRSGFRVKSGMNPFAMTGKVDVPISIHPNLPPGTILGITWQLPYPVNEVPNVVEKKLRRDYYQMEWPLRSRKYESGVYFDGVLACYFPPALSVITNIAPTTD